MWNVLSNRGHHMLCSALPLMPISIAIASPNEFMPKRYDRPLRLSQVFPTLACRQPIDDIRPLIECAPIGRMSLDQTGNLEGLPGEVLHQETLKANYT